MYYRTVINSDRDFKIGKGWPYYKQISVEEMENAIGEMPLDTTPRFSTMPGNSTYSSDSAMSIRDRELLKQLYTNVNKILYPYVVRVIAEFDYMGSPIYDEMGIDRETMAQLVSRVLDLAQRDIDEVEEIRTENDVYPMKWNRNMLIKNVTESLLLEYIFHDRRPRYRALRRNYGN